MVVETGIENEEVETVSISAEDELSYIIKSSLGALSMGGAFTYGKLGIIQDMLYHITQYGMSLGVNEKDLLDAVVYGITEDDFARGVIVRGDS